MSEFDALVKGVIADPGGAGVLADWLQERGREREAVLLRRYWETWQRTLFRCAKFAHLPGTQRAAERATENIRAYVRARFAGRRVECVRVWAVLGNSAEGWHVAVPTFAGHQRGLCGLVMRGGHLTTAAPRRVCPVCRERLTRTDTPLLEEVPE